MLSNYKTERLVITLFQLRGKHLSFTRKRQETSTDCCCKEYV